MERVELKESIVEGLKCNQVNLSIKDVKKTKIIQKDIRIILDK
jgi:hypothetical protein